MQWDQRKCSFKQARMRDFEVLHTHDGFAEEKNIQVERARSVADFRFSIASEGAFNFEQSLQQGERFEIRFEGHDSVHKARLIGDAHGPGRVEMRTRRDRAELRQALRGRSQRGLRRAGGAGQIGAHSDVGGRHTSQVSGWGRPAYAPRRFW